MPSLEIVLALGAYTILTMVYLSQMHRFRVASPVYWYPVALLLITVGTLFQIDFSHPSDVPHLLLSFLAFTSFAVPCVVIAKSWNFEQRLAVFRARQIQNDTRHDVLLVFALFVLALLATTFYFVQTGTNVILSALTSGIEGDYSGVRLALYAGEVYYAPGYFNQFKNFLLPLTSALIAYYAFKRDKKLGILIATSLFAVCLVAVAGAGQRTYVVYASAATVFGLLLLNVGGQMGGSKRVAKSVFLVGVASFVAYILMTDLYKGTEGSWLEAIAQAFRRIFYVQQKDGLLGFRFIYDRPTVWFSDWFQSIAGVLPGVRGEALSNEIHHHIYGSFRGTAPLSLVGSAYYNGGYAAVVILFSLLGVVYSALYARFLQGPKTPSRCFAYGAMFLYLVTFFVGPLRYPLDNGVAAFAVFLLLRKIRIRVR